jgi:hypothetical protein
MIDSFLFDAGSVFLAAWALTLTTFVWWLSAVTCFHPKPRSIPLSGPITWLRPQPMDSDLMSEVRSPVLFLQTLEMQKERSHLKWQLFR